ncbi:chromate resistance protein [Pseudonocardia sp. CNS-139]|nr:chromate resistance protein [Pseudonocardia sp. CNS-139]
MSYRVPREPSTPRIAVWRKLKRLGVAQVGDGLVALPADARTREQLEWVAEDVEQAGGSATLWTARPESVAQERRIAAEMAAARAQEYRSLCEQAGAATSDAALPGTLRRLRAELRRIERRDHFPPPEREVARRAVRRLADAADAAAGRTGGPA